MFSGLSIRALDPRPASDSPAQWALDVPFEKAGIRGRSGAPGVYWERRWESEAHVRETGRVAT